MHKSFVKTLQLCREAKIHVEHSVADLPDVGAKAWGSSASMAKVLVDTVSGRRAREEEEEEEKEEVRRRWMVSRSLSHRRWVKFSGKTPLTALSPLCRHSCSFMPISQPSSCSSGFSNVTTSTTSPAFMSNSSVSLAA